MLEKLSFVLKGMQPPEKGLICIIFQNYMIDLRFGPSTIASTVLEAANLHVLL